MSGAIVGPLAGLPRPSARRLAVRATADAVRRLRAGEPWLYDRSITSGADVATGATTELTTKATAGAATEPAIGAAPGAAPGDLAVVFDGRRKFVAIGLWDPRSPMRVKVLHAGAPAQLDDTWWQSRLAASIERRASLAADGTTTAYRMVHGENDGFPALVVDRYADTLVVKLYSEIWFPHLAVVVAALEQIVHPERVVLRFSRHVASGETFGLVDGATVHGEPPAGPIRFRERGLLMLADVVRGQKTGHFLDQRDNRALVRSMAAGATVLDVFASTGGFSLAAAAGGARRVHLVDASAPALAAARRNFELNARDRGVRACDVRTTVGDAFDVLADLRRRGERADIVILDPPSFAQNAASVEHACRAYARLTRAGLGVLEPGGTLVQASCSSRVTAERFGEVVHRAAADAGYELIELRRTGHPLDHPVGFEHGAYLKAIYATATPGSRLRRHAATRAT
jgi:23S rRNA (cytosine1962-C5)-methyltransferase